MTRPTKSRSADEYAYAAMAMLSQIIVSDEDETTVVLPSTWLREMQRWEHRITVGPGPIPKRQAKLCEPVEAENTRRANAAPEDPAEVAAVRDEVRALLARLTPRERRCLAARYGLDGGPATLREAGEALGVTRERARQIQARAEKRAARRTITELGDPREKRT